MNADSYTWLQGNGGSSLEALPQLTYNQAGSYTLTLFAHYTPLGCVDSAKAAVTQPVETYTFIVRVRTEADEVLEKSGTLRLIR